MLDHVIVAGNDFHSFAENGEIELSSSEYIVGLQELRELPTDEFNKRYAFGKIEAESNNVYSI